MCKIPISTSREKALMQGVLGLSSSERKLTTKRIHMKHNISIIDRLIKCTLQNTFLLDQL